MLGERGVVGHRLVAGEDAACEKAVRGRSRWRTDSRRRGSRRESAPRSRSTIADVSPSTTTRAYLHARPQPQFDPRDDTEEPVPADREPEQLGVSSASSGARHRRADEVEGFDLVDDRCERQAAPVGVAGERAAQAEPIGAGSYWASGTFRMRVPSRFEYPNRPPSKKTTWLRV